MIWWTRVEILDLKNYFICAEKNLNIKFLEVESVESVHIRNFS